MSLVTPFYWLGIPWDQYKDRLELGASVAVIRLRTVSLLDELTCSLDGSVLLCRYVDKLEKIFQSAPSDPTQDFSTQVYVEFWWEKEGWGCLGASPLRCYSVLCCRFLPQALLLCFHAHHQRHWSSLINKDLSQESSAECPTWREQSTSQASWEALECIMWGMQYHLLPRGDFW